MIANCGLNTLVEGRLIDHIIRQSYEFYQINHCTSSNSVKKFSKVNYLKRKLEFTSTFMKQSKG